MEERLLALIEYQNGLLSSILTELEKLNERIDKQEGNNKDKYKEKMDEIIGKLGPMGKMVKDMLEDN